MRDSAKQRKLGSAGAILALVLAACAEPSLDEELQAFIDETVAAAEGRDTGYFRGIVADSYIDGRGSQRDDTIDLIRAYFLLNNRIDVEADIVDAEWTGTDSVRVVLDAHIDGNMRSLSPQLELELLRDGSDWTVIGAYWDESGRR